MKNSVGKLLLAAVLFSVGLSANAADWRTVGDGGTYTAPSGTIEGYTRGKEGAASAVRNGTLIILDGTTFYNNHPNSNKNGGALAIDGPNAHLDNQGNITFDSNTSDGANGGGAVYIGTDYKTDVTIKDAVFTNNNATAGNGGAIFLQGTLNLQAVNRDVEFNNNTANGVRNAIHMFSNNDSGTKTSYLNINAAANKSVIFNDGISSAKAYGFINKEGAGTLELNANMNGYLGTVNLKEGTVKIGTGGSFFTGAKAINITDNDITLDTQNGLVQQTNLGTINLTKNINAKIDVDLLNKTIDNFIATSISGSGKININSINIKATIDAASDTNKIQTLLATGDVKNFINLTNDADVKADISGSSKSWYMSYNSSTGNLQFIANSLKKTANDSTATGHKHYIMNEKEEVEDDIGALMGVGMTVNGNDNAIDGMGHSGIVVNNSSQELIIKNVSNVTNFTDAALVGLNGLFIDNSQGGTVRLENVTATEILTNKNGSGAVVYSGGPLYVTGSTFNQNEARGGKGNGGAIYHYGSTGAITNSTFYKNSAYRGGAVYNTGTLTDITGSFIENEIKSKGDGGAIYNYTNAHIGNIIANFTENKADKSGSRGGAVYNTDGTIDSIGNSTTKSTFTDNYAKNYGGAIASVGNGNAYIGYINADFNGNSADNYGGAIYNGVRNSIGTISGTFTNNSASSGGAIYNAAAIDKISNAEFTDNKATGGLGGAIYNKGTSSSLVLENVKLNAPTGTALNDIYNEGTISTSGTNTFETNIKNEGTVTFGGNNTINSTAAIINNKIMEFGGTSNTINADITSSDTLKFTAANTSVVGDIIASNSVENTGSTIINTIQGNGNFKNSGNLTISGNASTYTGAYTQTSGSTTLDGTLFGDTNTINGGTFNHNGNIANGSTLQINGGNYKYNGISASIQNGAALKVESGKVLLENSSGNALTISGDSYIKSAAQITLNKGEELTVKDLSSSNATGLQVNNKDTWNGNINVESGGILKISDFNLNGSGTLTQIGGQTTFTNSKINASQLNVSAGNMLLSNAVLNYTSGASVSPDLLTLSDKSVINMINSATESMQLNNLKTNGINNVKVDLTPTQNKFDKIIINGDLTGSGALKISDFNVLGAVPTKKEYKFQIFDVNGNTSDVDFLATSKKYDSPIGRYILKSNGGGSYSLKMTGYNPQVYRGQVASLANYNNQLAINNIILDHLILNTRLPENNDNKYASALTLFAPYQHTDEEGGLWYKSYVDFETLTFNHHLSAHNNAYGSLVGADLPLVKLKHGWDFIPTFYIGYNGASQSYNNVHMYQNGGQGGFMGTFKRKDFIGSLMAYGGGYNNEMHVAGYTDRTGNWFAGTAAKLAYNLHPTKHFIIQPTAFMSYNIFGKQNWSSDFGSLSMNSGLINGINVAPGVNFIYKRETWSLYASAMYMYNINEQTSGRVATMDIPNLKMRHGYLQYGIGATKTWKDRLASFFQVSIRNGGRTGIGFQLGFKFSFGDPKTKRNNQSSAPKKRTVLREMKS